MAVSEPLRGEVWDVELLDFGCTDVVRLRGRLSLRELERIEAQLRVYLGL